MPSLPFIPSSPHRIAQNNTKNQFLGQTGRPVHHIESVVNFLQTGPGYGLRQKDPGQIEDPVPGPGALTLANVFRSEGRHPLSEG